jgi:hypothetical protein
VVTLLSSVDATAHSVGVRRDHPELAQGAVAGRGELIDDLVEEATGEAVTMQPIEIDAAIMSGEIATIDQLVGDGDPEPPADVVVATAGQPDRVGTGSLPQRTDGLGGRQPGQRFDQLADLVTGQPEVSPAASPAAGC